MEIAIQTKETSKPRYTLEQLCPKTRWYVTIRNERPDGTDKNGKPHYGYSGIEYYTTPIGRIKMTDWMKHFLAVIREEGKEKLFKDICDYCQNTCPWLTTEDDVKFHAAECLCHKSYLHWKNFNQE